MEAGTKNGVTEKHFNFRHAALGMQGHLEVPCRKSQDYSVTSTGLAAQLGMLPGSFLGI